MRRPRLDCAPGLVGGAGGSRGFAIEGGAGGKTEGEGARGRRRGWRGAGRGDASLHRGELALLRAAQATAACLQLGRRPRASLQVPWGRAEGAGAGACLRLAQTGEGCGCGWAGGTGALADTELGDGVEVDEVE